MKPNGPSIAVKAMGSMTAKYPTKGPTTKKTRTVGTMALMSAHIRAPIVQFRR